MTLSLRDVAGLAAAALADHGRPPADVSTRVARAATVAICTGLAMVFGLAALGCAAVALWIVAAPAVGSAGAALAVAALLLLACLVAAWIACAVARPTAKAAVPAADAVPPSVEELLAQGLQLFKDHKGAVLLAALVGGLVSGTATRK
jgi:hypothetical protein